jgi:hypothetical protein
MRCLATRTHAWLGLLLLFFTSLAGPPKAGGQELRGRVQGVVTDSTDAVIPGAVVSLENDNTGVATVRNTTQAGQYLFDFVSPGVYTLAVQAEGFRQFVQQNILVQSRADVTVNAPLQIGAVAETITVTEAPVSVKFNTTTLELTLDTKTIRELPIIHRNPFLLAQLNPAVVLRGTLEREPYKAWSQSQLDVGGNTSLKNDVLVDGVPNLVANQGAYVPPQDAVSELVVQQNPVDAEFGHSAGSNISLQTKSGTNDFHGSAYYFGRHPKLNAVANSITHRANLARQHVWGASAGNAIKKNKLFNYVAYEQWKTKNPRTLTSTLPTTLERQGDFSQSRTGSGGLRQIFDPWTTQFDPQSNSATREPFQNNVIPKTRMDPTALAFLDDVWQPNSPGDDVTNVNNFRDSFSFDLDYWNITNRTDWNITDKWKIFGRYSQFHHKDRTPDVTGSPAQDRSGTTRRALNISGDAVWTINPTTVFNIRAAYVSVINSFDSPDNQLQESDLARFWSAPWYSSYLTELPRIYYPGLSISRASGGAGFGRSGYWFQEPKTANVQTKISKQVDRHYLKVGGEYRNLHMAAARPRSMRFRFTPHNTATTFINPDIKQSGDGWATFLLGVVDNASEIKTIPLQKPTVETFGVYIQDDFKVNTRLTLNMGLRYEFETPMRSPENRLSRFLDFGNPIPEFQAGPPDIPQQVLDLRDAAPSFNGAWIFTDSENRRSWNPQKAIFLPRFGLAYRLNDVTALRIGWSRNVVPSLISDGTGILGSSPYPGFDAQSRVLPLIEGVPQSVLSDPYPADANPLIAPVGKTLGRYTNLGGDADWFHQDWRGAVNDRINVSVQRQLPGRLVADVTYFVNFGRDHPYESVDPRQPPRQHLHKDHNQLNPQLIYTHQALLDQKVPNPFFGYLTPDVFPGQLRNQRVVAIRDLLTPFPHYGALREWVVPGFTTLYQALQIKVQRPFANGFNLVLGYNHNEERRDEFFNDDDRFLDIPTRQDSPFARNRFLVGGIYELPFGAGRKYGQGPAFLNAVFGGWSISGIYTYYGGDFTRFGSAIVDGNPRIDNPTRERRFDTSKFTRQPAFTPRGNPLQYAGVHDPRLSNLDLTLAKLHSITERLKLEIRLEAYNFTNSFMGAGPNVNVDSSLFGMVTRQRSNTVGRQLQYTARLRW